MTREIGPERIWWHWMKAHTNRKGPTHEQHNRCDRDAKEATKWKAEGAPRFVMWDWEVVLCKEDGERIEGDP